MTTFYLATPKPVFEDRPKTEFEILGIGIDPEALAKQVNDFEDDTDVYPVTATVYEYLEANPQHIDTLNAYCTMGRSSVINRLHVCRVGRVCGPLTDYEIKAFVESELRGNPGRVLRHIRKNYNDEDVTFDVVSAISLKLDVTPIKRMCSDEEFVSLEKECDALQHELDCMHDNIEWAGFDNKRFAAIKSRISQIGIKQYGTTETNDTL